MANLAALPFVQLKFDKSGAIPDGVPHPLCGSGVSDLIVISHGWHQDPDDAGEMYRKIAQHFVEQGGNARPGRSFAVVEVYWPSDQFRDDLSLEVVAVLGNDPAAAAAAAGSDADASKLVRRARELGAMFGLDPDVFVAHVREAAVNTSPGDARVLVEMLRGAIGQSRDADLLSEHGRILDQASDGWDLMQSFLGSGADQYEPTTDGGAQAIDHDVATGAALGIFSGPIAAVAKVLNQFAYFELKRRAGVVGTGLGSILDTADLVDAKRIHYVGHSFGARLVTAAVAAMQRRKAYSLTLLQGAFSHNAFGVKISGNQDGFFRSVVADGKVSQRIVVSHTWNDHAVGLLYAVASRASGDIAKGVFEVSPTFGGSQDLFGAMGANGPQKMKSGEVLNVTYDGQALLNLKAGIHSLRCDFIKDHHDIRTAPIGRLLVAASA